MAQRSYNLWLYTDNSCQWDALILDFGDKTNVSAPKMLVLISYCTQNCCVTVMNATNGHFLGNHFNVHLCFMFQTSLVNMWVCLKPDHLTPHVLFQNCDKLELSSNKIFASPHVNHLKHYIMQWFHASFTIISIIIISHK